MRAVVLVALGTVLVAATASAQSNSPTFYKDVLPILQNNCQTCHRPGEVAPINPMVGIPDWAAAGADNSGAEAAPLSRIMKSRRRIALSKSVPESEA